MSLFSAALTLLGVLLLAYWCSRALGKRWGGGGPSGGHLRIADSIQVGPDRRIVLLRAGEQSFLVGVSQAGIQLLAEVEGDFEPAVPAGQDSAGWPSFQELMGKYGMGRKEKNGVDR